MLEISVWIESDADFQMEWKLASKSHHVPTLKRKRILASLFDLKPTLTRKMSATGLYRTPTHNWSESRRPFTSWRRITPRGCRLTIYERIGLLRCNFVSHDTWFLGNRSSESGHMLIRNVHFGRYLGPSRAPRPRQLCLRFRQALFNQLVSVLHVTAVATAVVMKSYRRRRLGIRRRRSSQCTTTRCESSIHIEF